MITYIEESKETLNEYKTITISFEVKTVYDVELINNGLGGFKLVEKEVIPYWYDYDGESDTSNPFTWASRWDIKNWLILVAYDGNKRVGGAVVAYKTDGVNMLESKDDLAVLWDLRIDPNYRGKGIGSELVARCLKWSAKRNCTRLKIETQNYNVNACKFYIKNGAKLISFNRYAYNDIEKEVQLIWNINL